MDVEVRHKEWECGMYHNVQSGDGRWGRAGEMAGEMAGNNGHLFHQDRLLGNSFVVLGIFHFVPCEPITHRN